MARRISYYTCFISYSVKDEAFATRLYADFAKAGIRAWKWDVDARTGEEMWSEIGEAIRDHHKLVLLASKSSLRSPAVFREIERAIHKEDELVAHKQKGTFAGSSNVLFPVRLDDYIFKTWQHPRKIDVTQKVIADAREWDTDPSVYPRVSSRLVSDLEIM